MGTAECPADRLSCLSLFSISAGPDEKEEEGCYWELTQARFYKGDMVQPNDENGFPMYSTDEEHKGYQAYSCADPNDKFSALNVPEFSDESNMEKYLQCSEEVYRPSRAFFHNQSKETFGEIQELRTPIITNECA